MPVAVNTPEAAGINETPLDIPPVQVISFEPVAVRVMEFPEHISEDGDATTEIPSVGFTVTIMVAVDGGSTGSTRVFRSVAVPSPN
jgi:hypothetical protein